mmetsp:Transcript_1867/g.5644  ORF Transcript_1867/g.5644 Transcript_1867/m.5644 type:complete len:288 (+) Transcript_1867:83-946(+)|eukprot:CAMPEP_0185300616 /NCGR_PEP_ID=MMETSP1363-20130426/12147_1 /TAXON_ID=38817 /ORGANISM="Gephyrocapsa oceanica, Strain RCC1303" /LENGTH=287 /DNA_ID=CAMNT_0027897587 /DNA_START=84 /DNA_END=947 /DNA_ORIENTATION=-
MRLQLSRRLAIAALAAAVPRSLLPPLPAAASFARATDESDVAFEGGRPVGLKLLDLTVYLDPSKNIAGSSRVIVSDVLDDGQAAERGVKLDSVIVAIDGENVELERAAAVQSRIEQALGRGKLTLTIKDPTAFQYALLDPPPGGASELVTSTALTPSSEGRAAQLFAVRRSNVPPRGCRRPAADGDLIEIGYEGRLAGSGALFDGMELAKRQGDETIQFVLGRQPAGQFPPSWDVGLVGMCIGEQRTLEVPPTLGYGAKGLPKRGVPPDAALTYRVELVAINGLAMD